MSEKQREVVGAPVRAAQAVVAKRASEVVLKKLDEPRNRGGRHLVAHTPDGDVKVYRDNVKHRIVIEHPRQGEESCKVSCKLSYRGVYISSGSNIRDLERFLNENPLTLTYFSLLQ